LGQLSLNLNQMIKPEKDSEKCGLQQLPDVFEGNNSDQKHHADQKFVSLFEQRRLKGWWPCIVELSDNKREIAVIILFSLEIFVSIFKKNLFGFFYREKLNWSWKF
jgi:hypothetical protein